MTIDPKTFVRIGQCIARAKPTMSAEWVLDIAESVCAEVETILTENVLPDPNDARALLAWALAIPEVKDHLDGSRKIQAIKAMRAAWTGPETLGLKQAKEACDVYLPPTLTMPPRPSRYYDCPHGLNRDLCENPYGSSLDPHYPLNDYRDEPAF